MQGKIYLGSFRNKLLLLYAVFVCTFHILTLNLEVVYVVESLLNQTNTILIPTGDTPALCISKGIERGLKRLLLKETFGENYSMALLLKVTECC